MPRRLTMQGLATALGATVFALLLSVSVYAESVRVTIDRTTIWRNRTGTGGVLAVVRTGTRLEVRGREGRWLIVVHPSDPRQIGYILARATEPVDSPMSPAPEPLDPPPSGGSPRAVPTAPSSRPRGDTASTSLAPRGQRAAAAKTPGAASGGHLSGAILLPFAPIAMSAESTTATLLEQERRTLSFKPPIRPGLQIGGGYQFTPRLGITASLTGQRVSGAGDVSATIPHPILYGASRPLSGQVSLERTELAVHAQVATTLIHRPHYAFSVAGGPSFFVVRQDIIDTLSYEETYPYDSVTYQAADTRQARGNGPGFNGELLLTFPQSRRVSWQTSVRWTQGTVRLNGIDNKVKSGGGRATAGVVLRLP